MRTSIAQKLSLLFVAAVVILMATAIASYANTRRILAMTESASSAQDVLAGLDAVIEELAVVGASSNETELRGALERLQRLVQGDATRTSRFESLEAVLASDVPGRGADSIAALAAPAPAASAARAQLTAWRADERTAVRGQAEGARAALARAEFILRFGAILAAILAPLAFLIARNEARVRLTAGRAVEESEARLRAATDGSMDAFYVLRAVRDGAGDLLDFEFVDLNIRAEGLLGHARREVLGQRLCELIPANRTLGFVEKYRRVMETGIVLEEECEVTSRDYSAAWIHHQVVPMPDGVAITSRDVTEKKRQEDALRALSLVDELTGLYNRRGFLTLAQQQLKLARRGQRELVLLFVDMDDFKAINDTFGHQEGDTALMRAADILRHTFRDSDIIARLGGDEFVVLASDTGKTGSAVIINRLRQELRQRNDRDGYPYRLSFSVGAARFGPESPPSIEELLAAADAMLYEQKRHKRATYPAGAAPLAPAEGAIAAG